MASCISRVLHSLSRNALGAVGAAALAPALAANGALTSIDLNSNQLCGLNWEGKGNYTTVGIAAIADALRANGSLTKMRYVTPKLERIWV